MATALPAPRSIPLALPIPVSESAGPPASLLPAPRTTGDSSQLERFSRLTNPDYALPTSQWVRVQSTFLYALMFVPYAEEVDAAAHDPFDTVGDLHIEFIDGFIGKFPNRTLRDFRTYLHAPSKGVYHRSTPWYSQYETERAQQYFGEALAARIRANG